MTLDDKAHDRPAEDDREPEDEETAEATWTPPERSDQRPGEEAVQVNDVYTGDKPPPRDESHADDEQHPTGG
jgi:hypothetical protein